MPSHSAYLIEGTSLAWPSTKAEMQAKLGGATFKQAQSKTDTLYFSPASAELPLTTTFLDGIGVTHTVTLTTKEDEVHVLVPLPSKTFTRHINTYQSIEWQFNSSSGDGKGRTSITPGPTLAECMFTYSEKGTFHNHGILVKIEAYTLETSSKHEDQEKAFWEGDILREAAPFLHQYIVAMKRSVQEGTKVNVCKMQVGDIQKMQKMMQDAVEDAAKHKEKLDAELQPLIEKAFRHHDKAGNDKLDKAEAAVFFGHLVAEQSLFLEAVMTVSVAQGIKMGLEMAKMMGTKPTPEQRKETDDKIEAAAAKLRKKCEEMEGDYKANKTARDVAAFAVLDASGEGTLLLEEVRQGLMPGTEKNKQFMDALGFGEKQQLHAMGQQMPWVS